MQGTAKDLLADGASKKEQAPKPMIQRSPAVDGGRQVT
jgi:hypothetical protein